jgi:hypothetical protein
MSAICLQNRRIPPAPELQYTLLRPTAHDTPDLSRDRIQQLFSELFDPSLASVREQLAERLAQELRAVEEQAGAQAAEDAARAARRSLAGQLNAAVRRLRQAATVTEIGAALLETASAHAGRVALLVHKGDLLTGWRVSGAARNGSADPAAAEVLARTWSGLKVPISSAPALAQAVDSREVVVSLSLPDHLSSTLVELLGLTPDEKVYLFPLCLRQTVVGVVYADAHGAAEGLEPGALEMLCSVAEAALEALAGRAPVTARPKSDESQPDRLELPVGRPAPPAPADWSQMTAEERDLHLRAQRFARVLVADLQLYRAQEIRDGKMAGNLYGRLKDEIDKSRDVYARKFGHSVTALTDYFHLELLHTLADDQEVLLGPDYPGPLVATLAEP